MNETNEITSYSVAVKQLKNAILQSRYTAAKLVNKEMILLYYFVGKYVSMNSRNKNWGIGAIDNISTILQQELNGLRGFSPTNLKNMRLFYEEWAVIEPLLLKNTTVVFFDFMETENRQNSSDYFQNSIRQNPSDELEQIFFRIGFSQHFN